MAPRVLVIGLDGFELTLADELGFAWFTGAGIVAGCHAEALAVGEPVFGEAAAS